MSDEEPNRDCKHLIWRTRPEIVMDAITGELVPDPNQIVSWCIDCDRKELTHPQETRK